MGNRLSCPNGHAVISIDYLPFNAKWKCGRCKKEFSSNDERWRCCSKCDFDHCNTCIVAVANKPNHPHPLAYVSYDCSECGESFVGDRVYCPPCKTTYDACYRCALLKIMAKEASSSGKIKSITINSTPFASGATREAFRVEATMQDGEFFQIHITCMSMQMQLVSVMKVSRFYD